MKITSFETMVCSIAVALDTLGDRWTILVLRDLLLGLSRYDELSRSTDIPPTTLASRLRLLEERGLVTKVPYQSKPLRFEYVLTASGRDVAPILMALANWGERHGIQGEEGGPMEFFNTGSGQTVRLVPVDTVSGAPVALADVAVREGPGADDRVRWRLGQRAARLGQDVGQKPAPAGPGGI